MRRDIVALVAVALSVSFSGSSIPVAQAQETLAGVGAASGMAAGMGAMEASNLNPAKLAAKAQPNMPSVDEDARGRPRNFMTSPGASTSAPASTAPAAVHIDNNTGSALLNDLESYRHPAPRAAPATRRAATHYKTAKARRRAHSVAAQRAALHHKYRFPPTGWLRYYLPDDRYKVSSRQWKYVSLEDDPGDYPVQHYYDPSSPAMLSLLSRKPRNGQQRANKVIGFHDWQDAMRAGYRPDPVSLPEPGPGLLYMASLGRGPALERYVEYVYAGQVAPDSFASSLIYTQQVAKIVNSRDDTRPLLSSTMAQVYGAFIGQNPLPTTVGESRASPVSTGTGTGARGTAGGTPNGPSTGLTPLGADKREDDFSTFSNRAGSLANVPANNSR